jgi:hypothetical protein
LFGSLTVKEHLIFFARVSDGVGLGWAVREVCLRAEGHMFERCATVSDGV